MHTIKKRLRTNKIDHRKTIKYNKALRNLKRIKEKYNQKAEQHIKQLNERINFYLSKN
jgi:uncharacterized Zn finger protein